MSPRGTKFAREVGAGVWGAGLVETPCRRAENGVGVGCEARAYVRAWACVARMGAGGMVRNSIAQQRKNIAHFL